MGREAWHQLRHPVAVETHQLLPGWELLKWQQVEAAVSGLLLLLLQVVEELQQLVEQLAGPRASSAEGSAGQLRELEQELPAVHQLLLVQLLLVQLLQAQPLLVGAGLASPQVARAGRPSVGGRLPAGVER